MPSGPWYSTGAVGGIGCIEQTKSGAPNSWVYAVSIGTDSVISPRLLSTAVNSSISASPARFASCSSTGEKYPLPPPDRDRSHGSSHSAHRQDRRAAGDH